MAARRTRIKVIAVIPQRRKNENTNEEDKTLKNSTESAVEGNKEEKCSVKEDSSTLNDPTDPTDQNVVSTETEAKNDHKQQPETNSLLKQPATLRRRLLKAQVSLNTAVRKPRTITENPPEEISNPPQPQKPEPIILNYQLNNPSPSPSPQPPPPPPPKSPFPEFPSAPLSPSKFRFFNPRTPRSDHSDSRSNVSTPQPLLSPYLEYGSAPASPSKINRARIKAVPRLGQRRTSFSASESEDETRKNYGRHRNDSICSVASGIQDQHSYSMDVAASPQKKEVTTVVQRKWKRTEQSRKLAEARREFLEKFGNNKPDRQKLTMVDLVFYNPTTNPMSQKNSKSQNAKPDLDTNPDSPEKEEEAVDDPEAKSDEENALPAPQIKIGADGEIVIDETSLVIENKELKRGREDLEKSKLVDGDLDTSYGVYKRVKRSKDWNHAETLRFYKALNTMGTDFTLMAQLFPGRTRKELKMKFKKEERMHKTLVDKALMQPDNFDLTDLEKEAQMEVRQKIEREKASKELAELKKQRKEERLLKASRKRSSESKQVDSHLVTRSKRKKNSEIIDLKNGVNSFLGESDADDEVDDDREDSESDLSTVTPIQPQPTRSGRIPKTPHRNQSTLSKPNKKTNSETDKEKLEPGSIVVVTSKADTGEPVIKLFMVTPNMNKVPLNVSGTHENMENILTISTQTQEVVVEENNVTRPAETEESAVNQVLDANGGLCENYDGTDVLP